MVCSSALFSLWLTPRYFFLCLPSCTKVLYQRRCGGAREDKKEEQFCGDEEVPHWRESARSEVDVDVCDASDLRSTLVGHCPVDCRWIMGLAGWCAGVCTRALQECSTPVRDMCGALRSDTAHWLSFHARTYPHSRRPPSPSPCGCHRARALTHKCACACTCSCAGAYLLSR